MRDHLEAGMTLTELARIMGVNRVMLRRHAIAAGINLPGRPGARRKLPSTDELITRIGAGDEPAFIARAAGLTRTAVHASLYYSGYRIVGSRVIKKESGNA